MDDQTTQPVLSASGTRSRTIDRRCGGGHDAGTREGALVRTNRQRVTVLVTLVSCGAMTFGAACNDSKEAQTSTTTTPAQGLVARVVAVGIPGAGPVTAVGR